MTNPTSEKDQDRHELLLLPGDDAYDDLTNDHHHFICLQRIAE